jgi:D-alanyl-lipoteichoic acid acyltransferase DltB (MBOAT superfamily)
VRLPAERCYSLPLFFSYCFYPPLVIAGPIITFNAFAHQLLPRAAAPAGAAALLRRPSGAAVARYTLRFVAVLACLEALTHTLHANAAAVSRAWRGGAGLGPPLTPPQLGAVSYWTLLFMWLKFTAVWRFFRLWALASGVSPPENMTRCVNNNYDIEGFWRNWHASFNRWLVRYLYVPLGGNATRWRLATVWLVFTFVALWHDPAAWKLLGWAWASALCLAPELAVKRIARSRAVAARAHTSAYRHARAAAAAVNITALMAANLVGFVLGLDGVSYFSREIFSAHGACFAAAMMGTFFAAAHIMFEIREGEARKAAAAAACGAVGVHAAGGDAAAGKDS